MSDGMKKRAFYDQQNGEAAAVILANVAQNGGEGSLMVRWARALPAGQRSQVEPRLPLLESKVA